MKKAFSIFVILAALMLPVFAVAQQAEETVTIKKSELTTDQLNKIEARQLQEKVDQYGKWVGVGHEVGTAINEGLAAVTTNASAFAATPPGKLTMFLIAYKVIGHDVLGAAIGIPMLIVGTIIWIWSYRRYMPQNRLVSETTDKDGKHIKTFEYGHGDLKSDEANGWMAGHWVMLIIFIVATTFGVIL